VQAIEQTNPDSAYWGADRVVEVNMEAGKQG
jgi:hypothetical protein